MAGIGGIRLGFEAFGCQNTFLLENVKQLIIVGFKENIAFKFPKKIGTYTPLNQILEDEDNIDKNYLLQKIYAKDDNLR